VRFSVRFSTWTWCLIKGGIFNYRLNLMFNYGYCFGVESTVDNIIALTLRQYKMDFRLLVVMLFIPHERSPARPAA
jgi:hypothetical protein